MTSKSSHYPTTASSFNPAEKDAAVIKYWKDRDSFKESVGKNKGEDEKDFVFYDGPPFANGLPHYGHLLTSFVKDSVARYKTMRGYVVERRFGWDCHGLPAEMETEKTLNISGRLAIKEFGIDKFNQHCRESVMKYAHLWQDYITRAGRWVDFSDDYRTMDTSYMESVIWAFKELHKKGLIYKDSRVMPYSWKCETPLSNFETRMDNSYRKKTSKAITVKFKLKDLPEFVSTSHPEAKSAFLLVWTTTPWTLPSNLALAVNKNEKYALIPKGEECYIVAEKLKEKAEAILG